MKVQCVICDHVEVLDEDTPLAKKLKNRPIHTFMCDECNERITEKTEARISTGKFKLFRSKTEDDEW